MLSLFSRKKIDLHLPGGVRHGRVASIGSIVAVAAASSIAASMSLAPALVVVVVDVDALVDVVETMTGGTDANCAVSRGNSRT